MQFDKISFLFVLAVFVFVALVFALWFWYITRRLTAEAEMDYTYRQAHHDYPYGISRTMYIRIYKRLYRPRAGLYICVVLGVIVSLTFPALWLLDSLLYQVWRLLGKPDYLHPGFLVWQYILFFALIGIWSLVAYSGARHFYKTAPGSLQTEIKKELQKQS